MALQLIGYLGHKILGFDTTGYLRYIEANDADTANTVNQRGSGAVAEWQVGGVTKARLRNDGLLEIGGQPAVRSVAYAICGSDAPAHIKAQADVIASDVDATADIDAGKLLIQALGGRIALTGGTINIATSFSLIADVEVEVCKGAIVKYIGAAGGTIVTNSNAVPLMRSGFFGNGKIDCNNLADYVMDIHSPQFGKWGGFEIINSRATTTIMRWRGDSLAGTGGYGGLVNAIFNQVDMMQISGPVKRVYDFVGENDPALGGIITENQFYGFDAEDVREIAIRMQKWFDNNVFYGHYRLNLRANNAIGWVFQDDVDPAVDVGVYSNVIHYSAVDTFNNTLFVKVFRDDGGVFTDISSGMATDTPNGSTFLRAAPAIDDAVYFGVLATADFPLAVNMWITTAGAGVWTIVWEYWDGAAWTAIPGVTDQTTGFTVAGWKAAYWAAAPGDAAASVVNGQNAKWIRARVSAFTNIVTQPKGAFGTYSNFYGRKGVVFNKTKGNIFNAYYQTPPAEGGWMVDNYADSYDILRIGSYGGGDSGLGGTVIQHYVKRSAMAQAGGIAGWDAANGKAFFFDASFWMGFSTGLGGVPIINFGSDDSFSFDRPSNTFQWIVDNVFALKVDVSGPQIPTGKRIIFGAGQQLTNEGALLKISPSVVNTKSNVILRPNGNPGVGIHNLWEMHNQADTPFQISQYDTGDVGIIAGAAEQIRLGTGGKLAFYGTAPIAKQVGVAVDIAAVHAALVNLGLIAA